MTKNGGVKPGAIIRRRAHIGPHVRSETLEPEGHSRVSAEDSRPTAHMMALTRKPVKDSDAVAFPVPARSSTKDARADQGQFLWQRSPFELSGGGDSDD